MRRIASRHRFWTAAGVGMAAALGLAFGAPGAASAAGHAAVGGDPGPPGTQTGPPRALDWLDQRDFGSSGTYSWRTTGRNVHAYVLGDKLGTTHTTFGGRATNGPDFTGDPQCRPYDNWGTGLASAVGGTRHGVAKEVAIVGVRIGACANRTTPERLVQGLDWITANAVKPAVAVLNYTVEADSAVDEAARRLIRSGVTLVTIAGLPDRDTGDEDPARVSPGRLPEAITVAQTWGAVLVSGTNRLGPGVDLFAPFSTMAVGTGSDEYDPALNEAGLVAGAAALVLSEHPAWTPDQVQRALVAAATPDLVKQSLRGAPNRMLYLGPTGS